MGQPTRAKVPPTEESNFMNEEKLQDYFERALGDSCLKDVDPSGDDVRARALHAVWDGLERLDALPRSDPFWRGSNGRATVGKLHEFCCRLLADDPRDARALWTSAGMELWWCSNEFGMIAWSGLHELELLDPRWPVQAALNLQWSSGVISVRGLASFLDRHGLWAQAMPCLDEMIQSKETFARSWAREVVSRSPLGPTV